MPTVKGLLTRGENLHPATDGQVLVDQLLGKAAAARELGVVALGRRAHDSRSLPDVDVLGNEPDVPDAGAELGLLKSSERGPGDGHDGEVINRATGRQREKSRKTIE